MRATSFFARACVACIAIPATILVLSPFLHPAAGSHTPSPPPTLLTRAPAPSDGAPATQPIPIPIPIPPVPSTLLVRPSAPAATTPLLPPTFHNFTRPTPTHTHIDGPRPRSPEPPPASNHFLIIFVSVFAAVAVLLGILLFALNHSVWKRIAREDADLGTPAPRPHVRGVAPAAQLPWVAVWPLPPTRLAHDLRDVQRSQVPPRVVGGRDVEMVNREEPESRRRGWQAEHDEGMRREREREGMVEVDLREGERERKGRPGWWGWGRAAAVAVV